MQIGKKVKQFRMTRGMSQVELANKVNVDNTLICKLEAGKTTSSFKTLRKIAEALGVSVSDLLEVDEEPLKAKYAFN